MIAKLKEPIEYVQYLGEGNMPEIEAMFDKYGYDTDYEMCQRNRVSIFFKLKEDDEYKDRDELFLTPRSYIIFHKLLIPHLSKNFGVSFDDFSCGYMFDDIFEAENE